MNVEKAKGIVKKILRGVGVFLAGVFSALLLGSRVRNYGKSANSARTEQPDYSGEAGNIRTEIDGIREGLEGTRGEIKGAREAATDTSRILQEIRERKKSLG